MMEMPVWRDVESEVYIPGRWLGLSGGILFLLIGGIWFLSIGGVGIPFWILKLCGALFALAGGIVFVWSTGSIISPARVRHASADVLPDVPREPVIREGSILYGRLTHELCEDPQGWRFRPAAYLWRNDKGFLLGCGIPFMVLFAALATWVLHSQTNIASWPVAAVLGIFATAVCGGPVLAILLIGLRSGYRQLSGLTIPRNGNALELDSPKEPNLEKPDLTESLKWVFLPETKRQRLSIPRELVVAIQLCPWKYVVMHSGSRDMAWAVQGLLVLASSDEAVYHRLPILLTSDFVGAARIMQRLAETLHVPYLFCADAEGWKAEKIRANKRPPLRSGGEQS